jgi:hypothetical protein
MVCIFIITPFRLQNPLEGAKISFISTSIALSVASATDANPSAHRFNVKKKHQ